MKLTLTLLRLLRQRAGGQQWGGRKLERLCGALEVASSLYSCEIQDSEAGRGRLGAGGWEACPAFPARSWLSPALGKAV